MFAHYYTYKRMLTFCLNELVTHFRACYFLLSIRVQKLWAPINIEKLILKVNEKLLNEENILNTVFLHKRFSGQITPSSPAGRAIIWLSIIWGFLQKNRRIHGFESLFSTRSRVRGVLLCQNMTFLDEGFQINSLQK